MSQPPLHIFNPQEFETIQACPCTTGGEPHAFIASVVSVLGVDSLGACLLDMQTGETYPGLELRIGDNSIVGFPRLPRRPAQYLLVVAQTDAPAQVKNMVSTVQFAVGSITPDAGGSNIPISAPLSNSTVAPTFVAFGSLVGAAATTGATMTAPGGNAINGVRITQGVPAGMWMYQFTNVPARTGYIFNVTDSSGNSGSTINITVR